MISNEIIAELCREHFGEYEGFEIAESTRDYGDDCKKYITTISFDGICLGDRDISILLSIKNATNRPYMFVHYDTDKEKFVIQYETYAEDGNEGE